MNETKNSPIKQFNDLELSERQRYFYSAIEQYKIGDYTDAEDDGTYFIIDKEGRIYQTKYLFAICVMKYLNNPKVVK